MDADRSDQSPVFVDSTGRRRRAVRVLSVAGAAATFAAAGLLTAALLGAPLGPLASLPDPPATTPAPPAEQARPTTTTTTAATQDEAPVRITNDAKPTVDAPASSTRKPPGSPVRETRPGKGHGRPTDLPTPPGHTH